MSLPPKTIHFSNPSRETALTPERIRIAVVGSNGDFTPGRKTHMILETVKAIRQPVVLVLHPQATQMAELAAEYGLEVEFVDLDKVQGDHWVTLQELPPMPQHYTDWTPAPRTGKGERKRNRAERWR